MRERALAWALALGPAIATAAAAEPPAALIAVRSEPWTAVERLTPDQVEPGQRFALAFGARLGELEISGAWSDFRGQAIQPGRYALRYGLQPRLKDHVGVDAVRDFALLEPLETADGEERPEKWMAESRRVSGTSHPAVLALTPWEGNGQPPLDAVTIGAWRVIYLRIADLVLGFVVTGRAGPADAF